MAPDDLRFDAVTVDWIGRAGYRRRVTSDGLLVTDGELRWRISNGEHGYVVDFAERGDAYSRRIEAALFEDVERWLMLTTAADVRLARGERSSSGPAEEDAAPGFSIRSQGRDRLVLDRIGRERIRFVDVGDRAGDAISYTHLADLPLSELPGRLDSEAAR